MYLLSAQALLDVITGEPTMESWYSQVPARQVGFASIALGYVQDTINALPPNDPDRAAFANEFAKVCGLAHSNNRIEPFDTQAALKWSDLLPLDLQVYDPNTGSAVDMPDADRMILAIAIDRRLTLIERPQPYHAVMSGLPFFYP